MLFIAAPHSGQILSGLSGFTPGRASSTCRMMRNILRQVKQTHFSLYFGMGINHSHERRSQLTLGITGAHRTSKPAKLSMKDSLVARPVDPLVRPQFFTTLRYPHVLNCFAKINRPMAAHE